MRKILLSNTPLLIISLVVLLIAHQLVYAGVISENSAATWNAVLGRAAFFKLIYHDLYQQNLLGVAIIPLVAAAWVIGIGPIALVTGLRSARYRELIRDESISEKWSSPLLRLQIGIVLALNVVDVSAGLPLIRAIAGLRGMYDAFPILIYESCVLTIVWISFTVSSISSSLNREMPR